MKIVTFQGPRRRKGEERRAWASYVALLSSTTADARFNSRQTVTLLATLGAVQRLAYPTLLGQVAAAISKRHPSVVPPGRLRDV
jgi:hypothetical protein